ncbi:MAG: RDD family protein [Chitinophagaceae bacterium]|nr:RDD family protein [Oligoflexus sp.]
MLEESELVSVKAKEVFIPAGFWIRSLALLVDSIVLSIIMQLVAALRHTQDPSVEFLTYDSRAYVIYFVILGVYSGGFYAKKGATLGKKAFSLEVVDHQTGEHISFWRGFFRDVIGKNVSLLSLGIGYLMAAFNKDKRTLHDYIFDTRVVKRAEVVRFTAESPPMPASPEL